MQQNNASQNNSRVADWQVLGEFDLPVGSTVDSGTMKWLIETLTPLDLQADFLRRLLKSAQDAMMRLVHTRVTEQDTDHIHLRIFAPGKRTSEPQTWGFFRIEKIESATADKKFPDHAIEFYLYLEGE